MAKGSVLALEGTEGITLKVYSFRWNPRPQLLGRYVVLCAVLSALSIVVSWLAVLMVPGGFLGVGALYFASVFYAVTTYWFGGWGLVSSFVGAFVGSGVLTGMPVVFALPFAVADIWEPLVPFVLMRGVGPRFGVDPLGTNLLERMRNLIWFVPTCAILPPFLSGLWGTWILVVAGFVPREAFWVAVASWWIGAAVLLGVFVPPLCRSLGRYLDSRGLACQGIWS